MSYNLRKNRAIGELAGLLSDHDPDVLCLQECDDAALPDGIGDLTLVGATRANRLGIAVFARSDRFTVTRTETYPLKRCLHDRIAEPATERLVASRLYDRSAAREMLVASLHAAPLTASNVVRRQQIAAAFQRLDEIGPGLPTLMIGDYNYPYFQNHLDRRVRTHGYRMTVSDRGTYRRYGLFRGRFDLATSIGFSVQAVTALPQGVSDHRPILVTAAYESAETVNVPVARPSAPPAALRAPAAVA